MSLFETRRVLKSIATGVPRGVENRVKQIGLLNL